MFLEKRENKSKIRTIRKIASVNKCHIAWWSQVWFLNTENIYFHALLLLTTVAISIKEINCVVSFAAWSLVDILSITINTHIVEKIADKMKYHIAVAILLDLVNAFLSKVWNVMASMTVSQFGMEWGKWQWMRDVQMLPNQFIDSITFSKSLSPSLLLPFLSLFSVAVVYAILANVSNSICSEATKCDLMSQCQFGSLMRRFLQSYIRLSLSSQ